MGIDRKTKLDITLVIDNKPSMIKRLDENNKANVGNEDHLLNPKLWFSNDDTSIIAEEYYFEDDTFYFTGNAATSDGDVFVSFTLPLSDEVCIDVISSSIRRLNKLKTALEVLK